LQQPSHQPPATKRWEQAKAEIQGLVALDGQTDEANRLLIEANESVGCEEPREDPLAIGWRQGVKGDLRRVRLVILAVGFINSNRIRLGQRHQRDVHHPLTIA
jgi:hypothetical protein